MTAMDEGNIIFQQGTSGSRQKKKYEDLLECDIFSTRYVNNANLHKLGIYHSVYYLFESVSLLNFMERRDHTYEHLTREFLSSLIYNVSPNTASTPGTIEFHMFNVEYEYSTNQLAELLHIP